MQLGSAYADGRLGLSYELFPPKTPAGAEALSRHLDQLVEFRPHFMTCTYGAGGSSQEKTLEVVTRVKQTYGIPVASHLTCVGSTADQLRKYLAEARQRGVDYIVAIRGDPPHGQRAFRAVEGGLRHANELVALIRSEFPGYGVAVAGYPETHQEAPSPEVDLENLKRKVDAGADIVITQMFYDNGDYFRFRERCDKIGIRVPVVPGILPVTKLSQIRRLTSLCGASLPDDFVKELGKKEDEEWQFRVGVDYAIRQVRALIESGIPGVHWYVLNKSDATSAAIREIDEFTPARS